jgi:hypothetical protein
LGSPEEAAKVIRCGLNLKPHYLCWRLLLNILTGIEFQGRIYKVTRGRTPCVYPVNPVNPV